MNKRILWGGVPAIALAGWASVGLAQTDGAPAARAGTGVIEEVVVMARKREETSQTVPLAVTALTGDMLARNSVTHVAGLTTQVPSLLVMPGASASRSIPVFSIRGQSQQEFTILSDPSVSVYMGDIVVARQQGINQSLFDLEAVEVMKGPQGTLFGRNATGGAIHIRPRRPGDTDEGYVGARFGNHGQMQTELMVNHRLADWAQLRVAGQTVDSDGYITDVILDEKINYEHSKSGRVSLALQPMPGLDSLFVLNRYLEDSGGTGIFIDYLSDDPAALLNSRGAALGYIGEFDPQRLLAEQKARGIHAVASGAEQYTRVSTHDWSNSTRYAFNDALTLKNVIGQRSVSGESVDDNDGMPIPFLQIQRAYDFEQFSNELQLMGSHEALDWIVGAYYFREKGGSEDYSITAQSLISGPGSLRPQPPPRAFPAWSVTWVEGRNESQAVFAQATQRLDEWLAGLSVTAGLRYTRDRREATIKSRTATVCRITFDDDNDPGTPDVAPPVDACAFTRSKSFSQATYNLSVDYRFAPGRLVYAATRKGYRSGGFVRAGTLAALEKPYDPETVTDYELGLKADWLPLGRPLRTNLAVFQANYDDVQRLELDVTLTPPQTITQNAAKARIRGGELEFVFLPSDRLELTGFLSYINPRFSDYTSMTGADLSGSPFARAPETIYSLTARYSLPLPDSVGEVSLMANWYHTDGYEPNDAYDPIVSVSGYDLLNLRVDWKRVMGSSIDLGLFMRNALDEAYQHANFNSPQSSLGFSSRSPGEPRLFGLELRYRFGALAS